MPPRTRSPKTSKSDDEAVLKDDASDLQAVADGVLTSRTSLSFRLRDDFSRRPPGARGAAVGERARRGPLLEQDRARELRRACAAAASHAVAVAAVDAAVAARAAAAAPVGAGADAPRGPDPRLGS